MPSNFSVLIPDGESPFAFHVLTCLAQADGMDIHVLSRRERVMSGYSRFKKSFHVIAAEDPLEYIEEFCKAVHIDLIMPVDMNAILFFAGLRTLPGGMAGFSWLDQEQSLRDVSDKSSLANFLHEHHLPHPRTMTTVAEFQEMIREFPMPVLVKPRTSGNGEGISKYDQRAELIHLLEMQPDFFDEYLIQEYMEGEDVDCSVLCRDGIILAHTIQRSIHMPAESYQPAEGIEFSHDAQALETATRLMSCLQWTGIAHIDMRRRASNSQVEIIEINPRFWGSLQGSLHVGVNFPRLVCLAASNQEIPKQHYRDGKYMSVFTALKRVGRRQPVTDLLRETNFFAMLKDPWPNFLKLIGYIK